MVGGVHRHFRAFRLRPARMNSLIVVRSLCGLLIGLLSLAVGSVQAQQTAAAPAVGSPVDAARTENKAAASSFFNRDSAAATDQSSSGKLTRWFELNTAIL